MSMQIYRPDCCIGCHVQAASHTHAPPACSSTGLCASKHLVSCTPGSVGRTTLGCSMAPCPVSGHLQHYNSSGLLAVQAVGFVQLTCEAVNALVLQLLCSKLASTEPTETSSPDQAGHPYSSLAPTLLITTPCTRQAFLEALFHQCSKLALAHLNSSLSTGNIHVAMHGRSAHQRHALFTKRSK